MVLLTLIGETMAVVKTTYQIAITIQKSKDLYEQLIRRAEYIKDDLLLFTDILEQLQGFTGQVTATDESYLIQSIQSAKSAVEDIKTALEEVLKYRKSIKQIFSGNEAMLTRLSDGYQRLHDLYTTILHRIMLLNKITPKILSIPDVKKQFAHVPTIEVSCFDFILGKDTPESTLAVAVEQFNSDQCICYIKVTGEQCFVAYHLRTWLSASPKNLLLLDLVKNFALNWHGSKDSNPHPTPATPMIDTTTNDIHRQLAFSEYYDASDIICGLAMTESCMYIATKHTVIVVSVKTKETLAQYGTKSTSSNGFKQISSIHIPAEDSNSLYIVDRGQNAVHKYRIGNENHRFEYIKDYSVIRVHNETCDLVSCTIFKENLYVSDRANHCLHIFPVSGERQSHCFKDDSINPFSPGSLCSDRDYLYVANTSTKEPMILVLNSDCQPVHWFRHDSFKEILAIDIDFTLRHLYVLTRRAMVAVGRQSKEQPLIVTIDVSQARKLT